MFSYAESLSKVMQKESKKASATVGSKRKINNVSPGCTISESTSLVEMVRAGVGAVVDDKGVTRQAIVKYIKENYNCNKKELADVSKVLNDCVEQGHLLRVSGSGANGRFRLSSKGILEEGNAPAVTKISDDSAPSPVKKARIAKGGQLKDQSPPQESMSEEATELGAISSCKSSPVKVEEKEVMLSEPTVAKDAGKKKPVKGGGGGKKTKTVADSVPKKTAVKRKK